MKVTFHNANGELTDIFLKIKNLRFSPSANIINERVPIDGFECDIVTPKKLRAGRRVSLKDDDDHRWFYGLSTYAQEEDEGVWHLRVESELLYLDKKTMNAKMYDSMSLTDAIAAITNNTRTTITCPTSVVSGKTISGYCPKQTARERLQYILVACGLYIKSSFVTHPTLAELPDEPQMIPIEKTYWKPQPIYNDYVTAITVTAFSYAEGTPSSDDEYVKAGGKTYVVTRYETTLTNTDASIPTTAPENEVIIDNIGLIRQSNVDDVLTFLARYYFKRTSVDFECINNYEYFTGDMFIVQLADDGEPVKQAVGFAQEMDFTFGREAKARVTLGACDMRDAHRLRITYVSDEEEIGDVVLGKRVYHFPEGYEFTVTNPYLIYTTKDYWYVMRPDEDTYTDTMEDEEMNVTIDCYIALRKNKKTGVLKVVSVDEVNRVEHGTSPDEYYVAEIE